MNGEKDHTSFNGLDTIEQITPQLTWQLRRDVLYPGEYKHNMGMEEDNHGYHFGAFKDNRLIAVVSLFKHADDWQFRKFAVNPALQRSGVGRQLLAYITAFTVAEGGQKLWCNARISATGFYEKHGFNQTGNMSQRKGIDYVVMEKNLPAPLITS